MRGRKITVDVSWYVLYYKADIPRVTFLSQHNISKAAPDVTSIGTSVSNKIVFNENNRTFEQAGESGINVLILGIVGFQDQRRLGA